METNSIDYFYSLFFYVFRSLKGYSLDIVCSDLKNNGIPISVSSLSRIEKGKLPPKPEFIDGYTRTFQISEFESADAECMDSYYIWLFTCLLHGPNKITAPEIISKTDSLKKMIPELLHTRNFFSIQIINYILSLWNISILDDDQTISPDLLESVIKLNQEYPKPVLTSVETGMFDYVHSLFLIRRNQFKTAFSLLQRIQSLSLEGPFAELSTMSQYQMLRCYNCFPNPEDGLLMCEEVIQRFNTFAHFERSKDTMLLKLTYMIRCFRIPQALREFSHLLQEYQIQNDSKFIILLLENYGWAYCAANDFANAYSVLTDIRLRDNFRPYGKLNLALSCCMLQKEQQCTNLLKELSAQSFAGLTKSEIFLAKSLIHVLENTPVIQISGSILEGIRLALDQSETELADWLLLLLEKLLKQQQHTDALISVLELHNQYLHRQQADSTRIVGTLKEILKNELA